MRITNTDIIKLIPLFMRKDKVVLSFSATSNQLFRMLGKKFPLLSVWNQIDKLSESRLDELAWELNIDWYDKSLPIEIKRSIIKLSDKIHSKRGTKWAVEEVIKEYFGTGEVQEWFEYDGQPHYFKVHSLNPTITGDRYAEFMYLLNLIKRESSWLDEIITDFANIAEDTIYHGCHTQSYAHYIIGSDSKNEVKGNADTLIFVGSSSQYVIGG